MDHRGGKGLVVDAALTTYDDSFRPRLAAGVVVSLLAHAVLAVVILAGPPGFGPRAPLAVSATSAEIETPPIRPGISESTAVSINWLGFADPTEHQATPAETEQAALSPMDVGVPEVAEPVATVTETDTPTELPEPDPEPAVEIAAIPEPAPAEESPAEETPAEAVEESAEVVKVPIETPAPTPTALPEPEASLPVIALRTEGPARRAPSLMQVVKRATARAQAIAARAAARAAAAVPPAGEPREAIDSEKESDATSLERTAEWHPGRPPAVEGLEITTVRPRWTVTTRLAAVPRNPVVVMEFRKNGTIARARFLPGQDTGYRDVDGPLLDALYRWTARGKALDELAADDPEAVVSLTMRIVLIPERGKIQRSTPSR